MKYCPVCGTSASDNTDFCPKCGQKFGKEKKSAPKKATAVTKNAPKKEKKKNSAGFSRAVDFAERYDFSEEDYSREELNALSAEKSTAQRREIMKATARSISSGCYKASLIFFIFNVLLGLLAAVAVDTERLSAFIMAILDQFSARATETMTGLVAFLSTRPATLVIVFIIKLPILLICIGMYNFANSCASLQKNPKAAERPLRGAGVLRKINRFLLAFACVALVLVEGLFIYGIIWLFSMASGPDVFSVTVFIVFIVIMTIVDFCIVAYFLKFENTIDVTELNMRKGNARFLPSKYVAVLTVLLAVANLAFIVIKAGKLHSYIGILSTITLSLGLVLFAVTLSRYRKELINIEKDFRARTERAAKRKKERK